MSEAGCCCNQHGHFEPIVGAFTFSGCTEAQAEADRLCGLFSRPDRVERIRRAVDDYLAGLPEVENDGSTVVELVRRGESWHISIRAGKMYHETAEDSLGAAFDAVGRVLGEKVRQFVDSCAEVPTSETESEVRAQVGLEWSNRVAKAFDMGGRAGREAERAELFAALPPCQITDPEALAKLTPSRVRAYLKGKGWSSEARPSIAPRLLVQWRSPNGGSCGLLLDNRVTSFTPDYAELILSAVADVEARSAAAVYLDILQTEPEAPSDPPRGYAP